MHLIPMMDLRGSVRRLLPFLAWFPVPRSALKADVLAGIAVALVPVSYTHLTLPTNREV